MEDMAAACSGRLYRESEQAMVRHLVTDSRKLSFPSDSVFVAIAGERHDGHNYLKDMYNQQIRNFIVSRLPAGRSDFPQANFILVPDTLRAMQQICAMHRSGFMLPVIGITGSNGKTILKEWLFRLLQDDKIIVRSPKSYNSQVGVPLSVWQIRPHHELAIFEAGISRPGEMEYLQPVIRPDIGVLTNIGEAHQEFFVSRQHKLAEKLLLFREAKTLVYCRDHADIEEHIRQDRRLANIRLFTWSSSVEADVRIRSVQRKKNTTLIEAQYTEAAFPVTLPFTDQASIENAIHALTVLLLLGYSGEYISENIPRLSPVAMRMEQKQGINNCTIINDSYNSDPDSLAIALDFLERQSRNKKKTIILSDMLQTGRSTHELYRETGEILGREKVDRLIGIGNDIIHIRDHFSGISDFYGSTDDFIAGFNPSEFVGETVLLKGSRDFGFERISALLEEKAHATVMEINLDNLVRNFNHFKSLLDRQTKIMAVVKAFSYGSGSHEIANILAYNLVDYLAVAFVDEGVSLRKAGVRVPIMVMNPDRGSYPRMAYYNLEPEIYSLSGLRLFVEKLRHEKITSFPVHIKLDTGMYRLGFSAGELDELAGFLRNNENVSVKSVFSHLAASDEPANDSFTREQISMFTRMSDELCRELDYPVLRHILNSAGIERFPEAQFDMVRLGIGLYGISALENNKLANVNTFRSVISQIKEVPAGHSVGYSRAFKTATGTRIAVVPVGYADGLDRRLGNGTGRMLVNGTPVPVVGNICMDMCMIDIGGVIAREGDEVIIFGEDNSISDIAALLSTIPYEVFTNISTRVKRIYIQE
jgi:Alr-MurF fusion protein